jgi:hypothetical protein
MASLDVRAFGARISFGLSRELWLIEAGVFLNMLGYGGVLPFEIIYLHNGRGFSLGVAGLVVGTITGIAVVVSPTAGQLAQAGAQAARGRPADAPAAPLSLLRFGLGRNERS